MRLRNYFALDETTRLRIQKKSKNKTKKSKKVKKKMNEKILRFENFLAPSARYPKKEVGESPPVAWRVASRQRYL